MRYALSIALCVLLGGCRYDSMGIQKQYSADRDNCQNWSENKIGAYERFSAEQGKPMDVKSKNERLVVFFNECMSGKNWEIGGTAQKPGAVASTHLENRGVGVGVGPFYALERVENGQAAAYGDTTVPAYAYPGGASGYEPPPIANDLVVPSTMPAPQGGTPAVNGRVPEVTPTMQAPRAMPKTPRASPEKLPAAPTTAVSVRPKPTATQEKPVETVEPSQLMSSPTTPVTATEATPPQPSAAPSTSSSTSTSTGKLSAEQEKRLRKVLGSGD